MQRREASIFSKMERLVRSICDYRNSGMDVCLVSSGAIAVGRDVIGIKERPSDISIKQACAAVGQGRLMMTYQKLFSEYNQNSGQVLMTKKYHSQSCFQTQCYEYI